jgi:hypothetical protein
MPRAVSCDIALIHDTNNDYHKVGGFNLYFVSEGHTIRYVACTSRIAAERCENRRPRSG